MADAADGIATPSPGLSFSVGTFRKLTPGPFLHAHLKQQQPSRPNGRQRFDFRAPTINTGSLTHSNGSAVVRLGDTAIVCGVRGEVLLASDIPNSHAEDLHPDGLIEEVGLLVPNLELSTGCSTTHLPGNAPGPLAQSLSYRINSLLHDSHMLDPSPLCIQYTEPETDDDLPDQPPKIVTKAYWTLYIDILCLALDGNPFDAAWLAVTAALRNTILPKAWWDADRETVLCSPLSADGCALRLNAIPCVSTFAVFTTSSPLKPRQGAQNWILADPDSFEEDNCDDTLTVVLVASPDCRRRISKIESSGGSFFGKSAVMMCAEEAEARFAQLETALGNG